MVLQIDPLLAQIVMLVGVFPVAIVVFLLKGEWGKPGVKWLLFGSGSFAAWGVFFTLTVLFRGSWLGFAFRNVYVSLPLLTAIFWFMFCYEFTFRELVPKPVFGLLGLVAIEFVLAWFNPHNLMYRVSDPVHTQQILIPGGRNTLRFVLNVGAGYALVLLGTGMVVGEILRSKNPLRRRQSTVIIASTLIITAISFFKVRGLVPAYFDPTPVALLPAFSLLAFSVHKHELGRSVPAARKTAIETTEDLIMISGPDGRIFDANQAAKDLFDADLCGEAVSDVLGGAQELLEMEANHGNRFFTVSRSTATYGRGVELQVYVLSEITELKHKERNLDLIQQVMNRVFRHNVRNDLTPIIGNARILADKSPEHADKAETIASNAEDIHSTTEKAREVSEVIRNREREVVSLRKHADKAVTGVKDSHSGDFEIDADLQEVEAITHPRLYRAIEEAIENAIEHGESPVGVEVEIEELSDTGVVRISDDGGGIQEQEVETMEAGEETAVKHSNGAGLWMIKLTVECSGGSLDIYNDGDGTVIELRLPKPGEGISKSLP